MDKQKFVDAVEMECAKMGIGCLPASDNGVIVVIPLERGGIEALGHVTASKREIEMNVSGERMQHLARARLEAAVRLANAETTANG